MNDLELKLKLAKELPELILCLTPNCDVHRYFYEFKWVEKGKHYDDLKEVTDREWDWVSGRLIRETTSQLQEEIWHELFEGDEYSWADKTWNQIAEAYFKVKESK